MAKFCGYTYKESSISSPADLSDWCCVRETWKDTGQCIWHAEVNGKSAVELKKYRSEDPERLDGAFLREAEINDGLSFQGCAVAGADFTDSSLRGTNFENSNLYKSKFIRADLDLAQLSNACLNFAEILDASLVTADLSDALARSTDFSGSSMLQADIRNTDFILADLSSVYLENTHGPPKTLEDANLTESALPGVDLSGTDMAWTRCRKTDLGGANLEGCRLHRARMRGAYFGRANLKNIDLTEATAHECNLEGANLEGVDARRAELDGSNFENATFIRAELREASLKDTLLYQTVFSDVRINDSTRFGDLTPYDEQWNESFWNPFDASVKKSEKDGDWYNKAVWTYRRLEALHEENAMSERARWYHIRKQESRRQLYWSNEEYLKWGIYSANRWLTNHGESPLRVLAASAITILLSAILYPLIGISRGSNSPLTYLSVPPEQIPAVLGESFYFSTVTFTTLGYGDVQPASPLTQALAGIESLLGALLMALLVFVLGRRATR